MAKIIVTSAFRKGGSGGKRKTAGGLLKYMGTREDVEKLVTYMAERPGVEKTGAHGLFSQMDDPIDLETAAEDASNHKGIIWTHVVSLRREDAERLGYNNATAWKKLVRRNITKIAEAHKVPVTDLQWYGAFHNTGHHPHIHLMVYSKGEEGHLNNKGLDSLRSAFGNDIFRNEQYQIFQMQTALRQELKEGAQLRIEGLVSMAEWSPEPTDTMLQLIVKLKKQLGEYQGKKVYGYLPKRIKDTVNDIVAELAKNPNIARLNSEWNQINREKLSLYHEKETPDIPLEENKEFRSIKNTIIRAVLNAETYIPIQAQAPNIAMGIIGSLASLIGNKCMAKRQKLQSQVDSKLRSKVEQKKLAHGQKSENLLESTYHLSLEEYEMTM